MSAFYFRIAAEFVFSVFPIATVASDTPAILESPEQNATHQTARHQVQTQTPHQCRPPASALSFVYHVGRHFSFFAGVLAVRRKGEAPCQRWRQLPGKTEVWGARSLANTPLKQRIKAQVSMPGIGMWRIC